MTTYSGTTCSDDPNIKRVKRSINILPVQSSADGDHVLLSVVRNFGELRHADVDTGGRRESGVHLMPTTLDLYNVEPER